MEGTSYLALGKVHSKSKRQQDQGHMSWQPWWTHQSRTHGMLANWRDSTTRVQEWAYVELFLEHNPGAYNICRTISRVQLEGLQLWLHIEIFLEYTSGAYKIITPGFRNNCSSQYSDGFRSDPNNLAPGSESNPNNLLLRVQGATCIALSHAKFQSDE